MPERLTECLVRRGLLDPSRAREAIERQVLLGGALDTCLLEMRLVAENALVDAMAAAYGLATASAQEVTGPLDTRAQRSFPEQWAKKHTLAPVSLDAERYVLTVLSPAPPDVNLLVRLGELLELTIKPLLTAEYRVHQRLSLLYEEKPPERFRVLIDQLGDRAVLSPRAMQNELAAPRIVTRPLTFGEAVSRLKEARDRDEIVHTALAYAHRDLEYAAMFIVQGSSIPMGRLDGWAAVGENVREIGGTSLELRSESAFRVVLESNAHYLGPLPNDELHNDLLASIGRPHPRAALIIPVRIRGRTIALMYGENGPRTIPPRLAADLMLFTTHVQGALESLLVRKKVETLSELSQATSDRPAPTLEVISSQPDFAKSELPPIPVPEVAPQQPAVEHELEEMLELAEVVLESQPPPEAAPTPPPAVALPPYGSAADENTDKIAARQTTNPRTDYLIVKNRATDATPPPMVEDFTPPPSKSDTAVLGRIGSGAHARANGERHPTPVPPPFEPHFEEPVESEDLVTNEPDTDSLAVAYSPQADDWSQVQLAETADGSALIDELDDIPIDEEEADTADVDASALSSPAGLVAPSLPIGNDHAARFPSTELIARDDGVTREARLAADDTIRQATFVGALPNDSSAADDKETGDSWEAVSVDAWDEHARPKLQAPHLDGVHQEALRASLVEDSTLPDLSAEAWIRASSDVVRARALPPEIFERAAAMDEVVPLTRAQSRSESGVRGTISPHDSTRTRAREIVDAAALEEEPVPLTRATSQIVRARAITEGHPAALVRPPTPVLGLMGAPWSSAVPGPASQPPSAPPAAPPMPAHTPAPAPAASTPPSPSPSPSQEEPLPGKLVPVDFSDPKIARAAQLESEINGLLLRLESSDVNGRRLAREALIGMGPYVLPKIMERFPGQVVLDPFSPTSTTLPPFVECGELLAILASFGVDAHPYVVRRLDAPEAPQRFFATYFYAAVYAPEAIPRLVQRLHDEEPRICMLAARTLFSYRELAEFNTVLEHLHGRLDATSLAARKHAAYLIGLFRDVSAVPLLIALFEKKDKAMFDSAEGALAEITKQRFGPNPKKWRSWWTRNQARSRIGWLVDGLGSKEAAMRRSAAEELRAVTGVDFGYDEDAPRKHREDARLRWVRWWNDQYSLHQGKPDGLPENPSS